MATKRQTGDVQPKVAETRAKFLSKYNGNILDDTYDEKDVDWVKSNDAFIRNTLKAFKTQGNIDKAVDLIDEVLKFRAHWKVNSLKESDLHPALMSQNPVYFHGKDKDGHKIMYIRVSTMKKGQYPMDDIKRGLIYTMNKHYMENIEDQIVCCFDCTDASVTNFDVDMSKFVIKCNDTYFPEISCYALMFKLGRALEMVWALIKTFMNAEQTASTHVVSRKNIQQFIPADQLPPHMIK